MTIFAGDVAVPGTTLWKVGSLMATKTPPFPPRGVPGRHVLTTADARPGRRETVRVHEERTGLIDWTEVPAVHDGEIARRLYQHGTGGVLLVVEPREGGSAKVRGGPAPRCVPGATSRPAGCDLRCSSIATARSGRSRRRRAASPSWCDRRAHRSRHQA